MSDFNVKPIQAESVMRQFDMQNVFQVSPDKKLVTTFVYLRKTLANGDEAMWRCGMLQFLKADWDIWRELNDGITFIEQPDNEGEDHGKGLNGSNLSG